MRRLCLTVCNGVKLQKLIRDRKGVCWLGHVYTIWFFGPLGWFGLEGASLCAACASVCWDGLEYDHHRKHAAGISCTCFVVICWGGVQKVGVFAKVLIRHSWLNRHGCILCLLIRWQRSALAMIAVLRRVFPRTSGRVVESTVRDLGWGNLKLQCWPLTITPQRVRRDQQISKFHKIPRYLFPSLYVEEFTVSLLRSRAGVPTNQITWYSPQF